MIYSSTFSGLKFFVKATITFSENVQACEEGFKGRAAVLEPVRVVYAEEAAPASSRSIPRFRCILCDAGRAGE